MSPHLARPLLHTMHLLTFLVLLATGLLLFVPGLRALVTGGYSLVIRETHRWGGVAFFVLPILIILGAGARNVFAPPAERTLSTMWQGTHVAVTILVSLAFTLTGFVLWGKKLAPETVQDVSLALHDWLTYVVVALVALHLVEVGVAAVVARISAGAPAARQSQV